MKLVVVGSSNMDLVINLPRIPVVGETVLGGRSRMIFGGKGANQAVAAIRSGAEVSFITKVGKDIFGKKMVAHFRDEGFSTALVLEDKSEPTGIAQFFFPKKEKTPLRSRPGQTEPSSVRTWNLSKVCSWRLPLFLCNWKHRWLP